MTEALFLLLGLLAALTLVGLFTASALRDAHGPPAHDHRPTVALRVVCPETGGIKRVRLAPDGETSRPTVTWCARYGGSPLTCNRGCLRPFRTAAV